MKKTLITSTSVNFLCILIIVVIQACSPSEQPSSEAAERPPNVLFIAVDDLRPQLGCYGQSQIISPNIDRLAASGMLFERAYCQQAICAPSRISLLSGLRPDATGIYGLDTQLRSKMPDLMTLPRLFKNHGYQTVSLGKIYHHQHDDSLAWSQPAYRPEGNWTGRGYLAPASVEVVNSSPDLGGGRGPAYEAADVPDSAYPDGQVAQQALAEMNRLKDQPFFLAVGFLKPHLPFNAPQKYWDLYDASAITLPEVSNPPRDAPEMALTNWGELRNYHGIPKEGKLDEELTRTLIHGYYACTSYTDALIGQLLDELERLDLRNNTIVVLWGDHGWKLGDYGDWCKHTNFTLDTRVPLLLSVPGIEHPEGSTQALVELVDVYPTLAELAGLPLPSHLQGTSMVPLLNRPDQSWKQAAFFQYPRGEAMGYALRTDRYRFTRWQQRDSSRQVVALELYDHRNDSLETMNLAAHPEYASVVEELSAMLDEGYEEAMPTE